MGLGLLEVRPEVPAEDSGNMRSAEAERARKVGASLAVSGPAPYLSNILLGETRGGIGLPSGVPSRGAGDPLGHASSPVIVTGRFAAFGDHVSHVLGLGSREEMIGPHAPPVIATVEDEEAFGDRSYEKLVREAMGGNLAALAEVEGAVAATDPAAGPLPTTLRIDPNALPEPYLRFAHPDTSYVRGGG